jgi:hypothetical protein
MSCQIFAFDAVYAVGKGAGAAEIDSIRLEE